jgi:putative membrane protein
MIITKRIFISNVLKGLGRSVLIICIISVLGYFLNELILKHYFKSPGIIPAVLGTALAFFIGFNNNQAYDRWWEARKIWGALVNDSRSWARQIMFYTRIADGFNDHELSMLRKKTIYRHIAFLYALKENLRGSDKKEYKNYLSNEEFEEVELESNKQNAILNHQSKDLEVLYTKGALDGFRFIELNRMIVNFCDEMGQSERIKNTVFPTIYHNYTLIFIWVFTASVSIVFANDIGYWSILFGIIIGLVFVITQSIGLALLNPFDEIISGVPLNQITRTIEINLLEALKEPNIPKPVQSVDNKYIM